jgi:hypothetical protein
LSKARSTLDQLAIRERRMMIGLNQQLLGRLIGAADQHIYKI